MPTLRKYAPSSDTSGYYIQANVGGAYPITLQVTPLAARILRKTDHTPDGPVPTKLVWAMYDLGLLYTKKSLDTDKLDRVSTQTVFRDLNLANILSPNDRDKLIEYIDSYTGPNNGTLQKLRKELQQATGPGTAISDSKRDLPKSEAEALSCLFELAPNSTRFRDAKRSIDHRYLLQSLRTFLRWPYVEFANSAVTNRWELEYAVSDPESHRLYRVVDQSIAMPPAQTGPRTFEGRRYHIRIPDIGGEATAMWVDGEIEEFTPADDGRYTEHDLQDDLVWLLPTGAIDLKDIIGKSVTSFRDRTLKPLQGLLDTPTSKLQLVEVDRISNAGNPIVETPQGHRLLDIGTPGELYLAEELDGAKMRDSKLVVS
ncbi:hypothetical protein ACFQL9_13135 [Halobaculum lipolyticum]|uniref:Uncharacterized protein n=1 Tax=Halobaculum lipolyticum TaxID=3032001 RepID=A0ABD5WGX5_9EURY